MKTKTKHYLSTIGIVAVAGLGSYAVGASASPAVPSAKFQNAVEEVTHVVDGDTLDVTIYLGRGVSKRERLRLMGVDTPEMRGGDEKSKFRAKQARNGVIDWTNLHKGQRMRVVHNDRTDSFGRLLGDVCDDQGACVSQWLIENGLGDEVP